MSQRGRYLLVLIFLVLVSVYFIGALLPGFIANRTSLCGGCHATASEYRSWRRSVHFRAGVGCLDCHTDNGLGGNLALSIRAAANLASQFTGGHRPVTLNEDACLACHDRIYDDIVRKGDIRMSHREVIKANWACSDCHGSVGHNLKGTLARSKEASMDKCLACHARSASRCRPCHLKERLARPVSERASGILAHVGSWPTQHGAASSATCRACHRSGFCRRCHAVDLPHPTDWPGSHGKQTLSLATACTQCHTQEFCRDCHRLPMPHNKPYDHRADIAALGPGTCERCHHALGCANCHSRAPRAGGQRP